MHSSSTFCNEDLGTARGPMRTEIIQGLGKALSLLQAMSKGHEDRMATFESAVLKTSQDRDSCVAERLQALESSVAASSESVARH